MDAGLLELELYVDPSSICYPCTRLILLLIWLNFPIFDQTSKPTLPISRPGCCHPQVCNLINTFRQQLKLEAINVANIPFTNLFNDAPQILLQHFPIQPTIHNFFTDDGDFMELFFMAVHQHPLHKVQVQHFCVVAAWGQGGGLRGFGVEEFVGLEVRCQDFFCFFYPLRFRWFLSIIRNGVGIVLEYHGKCFMIDVSTLMQAPWMNFLDKLST